MKLFDKAADRIYVLMHGINPVLSGRVRNDLEQIHPGENPEEVCRVYYVAKLKKSIIIALGGVVLAICLSVRAQAERIIENGQIKRGNVLEESQTVMVETMLNGQPEQFEIRMSQRQMDEEEAERCYEKFVGELPDLIRGANASLLEVTTDLRLEEMYEGYPFEVEWKSEMSDTVDSHGSVTPKEEDCEVCLKAVITYGEWQWEQFIEVYVLMEKLTEQEQMRRSLEEKLLLSEKDTWTQEYWTLPEGEDGEVFVWERVVEDSSLLLGVIAILVSVVVYLLADKDLHQQIQKRREAMKGEYPDIVHKLVLYLGAGMTLQGSLQRIAAEYEQRKESGLAEDAAYEEILYTCRELRAGVSEATAYERFGKRTGLQEYIRLSTLMSQNLKKGSSSLLPRLAEEADRAMVERIQAGRKLGEEASTKLLLPMIMMLAVVMVMVMLPAFSSMGM